MAKRVGKAYDPELRMTEAGSRLYQTWRKVRRNPHCEEWEDFQTFYTCALSDGYELGDWLQLIDSDKPYGPDNVVWYSPQHAATPPPDYVAWAHDWNTAVNRIRKHYGMPPLEGTSYGD